MKKRIIDDAFISRLEALTLDMLTPMQGYFGGAHRTKTYGSTVEFADFREYMLGDDIRRIDWNLYSRFEKHFIKLFVDERQMHIQLFLDCSASMARTHPAKAEYALRLIAALGYLAVRSMDKVSFCMMKGNHCEDLCGLVSGTAAYYNAVNQLERVEFAGGTNMDKAVADCNNLGSNDGLSVIVSDFLTDGEWKRAVDYLCYRHRAVMLIQILSPEEVDPAYSGRIFLRDCESDDVSDPINMKMRITKSTFAAYKEALSAYISEIRSYCAQRGVVFLTTVTDEPVERLIFGRMCEAGVIR